MKRFAIFIILCCIVNLSSASNIISFAKNPDVVPVVSIRSPQDHTIITEDILDVEIQFSSKEKGSANVRYIKLKLDGNEVAIYQNEANIKESTHTFQLDITDLNLGEHTLQAFAYQGDINAELEGKSPMVIFTKSDTPIPSRIIKNPTANPDGIFVDELTLVTITAEINPDPELIESEIILQRLNELNQPIEFLGYLHDDGLEGDLIANDNIYTLEIDFIEAEPSEIKLRIFADYETLPTIVSSDVFIIDTVIPISEEDFGTILEVEEKAAQEFERLKEQHNDDVARQLTVNWLKRQYGVEDAGISIDNDTIWILFTSGLEGGITTHSEGIKSNPSANSTDPPVIPEATNAIVLAPFFDEFSPLDESDYISEKLSQLWSSVSTIKNSAVTVDLMKTLSQYAVVSISSHGSINSEGEVQISTREKATPLNRLQHIFDLMAGRVRISIVDSYYMITPTFIRYYGHKYPRSLIYISACKSIANNTMSNAFLDKGAYTYFGYNRNVWPSFTYTIGTKLFNYLLEDRMTTGDAFVALGNKTDSKYPHAEFLMAGGDDLVLAEIPVITDENPTGEVTDKRPTIQARIYSPSDIDIDLSTIVMTLDGLTITPTVAPEAGGSDITITYTPSADLDDGEHTVVIDAKDAIGLSAEQKRWFFTVTSNIWEETWEGASLSVSDSRVVVPQGDISFPTYYDITGDHLWRAMIYRRVSARVSAKYEIPPNPTFASYNFTLTGSSEGINWNANCTAYAESTWGMSVTAYSRVSGDIAHYFSPIPTITEKSQLIWTGSGDTLLLLSTGGIFAPQLWARTPGTYSLGHLKGRPIFYLLLFPVKVEAEAGVPMPPQGELPDPPVLDYAEGNSKYGSLKITHLIY